LGYYIAHETVRFIKANSELILPVKLLEKLLRKASAKSKIVKETSERSEDGRREIMKKEDILNVVKAVKQDSKKRNFKQSFDLVINLKAYDAKKQPIEAYVTLPKIRKKKLKICAIVDKELSTDAKDIFDKVILKDDFPEWQGNPKVLRKLAREYDYFVAQANIMPQIAGVFGKYLGPKAKMPNPKSGAIIPPKIAGMQPIYDKLQQTVKIVTKNEAIIKCFVGTEENTDEELADNVMAVYNTLLGMLPGEESSVKSVVVKMTMGKPFKVTTATGEKK